MEKWNAYTKDFELTDKTLIRGEPIPEGLYHLVCEVLVRHRDGSILCMKRSLSKEVYAGLYETSVGGAALFGEDDLTCIRRELEEETGILCDTFTEIGRYVYVGAIFHCFVCTVDVNKDAVCLQKGETEGFMWLDREAFCRFLKEGDRIESQLRRYRPYLAAEGYTEL